MDEFKPIDYILSFKIEKLIIGLSLKDVNRAIRAVEILPLPGAPDITLGVINLGGNVIPILNFRKRFNLKNKKISPNDKIVIVQSGDLEFGFIADDVIGLKSIDENAIEKSEDIIPGMEEIIDGVVVLENEIVLIHDIHKFLSLKEYDQLSKALNEKDK